MKLLINTRLLIKNRLDGIAWFTFETLKRITQNYPEHQFYFLFDRPYSKEFIFSENVKPIVIGPPTRHPFLWYLWFEYQLPGIVKRLKPDIFVSPDGYLSLKSKVKSYAVVHDINFLHYPKDLPLTSRLFYNYFFPKYAKKADGLGTVSEYSKADIIKNYKISSEKIDVLYNGANEIYEPISEEKQAIIKEKYTQGHDFFVFVGSLHPRKNVENMLKAYELYRNKTSKRIDFIIIGEKFFMTKNIRKTWDGMSYKNNVHFVGRMEPYEMKEIVGSAIALVLVSKLEGFGIPVIEAYKCGVPAILSNVSSLPEIGADAAIYADPFSVESISETMNRMVNENGLSQSLIVNCAKVSQKYSWDKTANNLWEGIIKVLENQ